METHPDTFKYAVHDLRHAHPEILGQMQELYTLNIQSTEQYNGLLIEFGHLVKEQLKGENVNDRLNDLSLRIDLCREKRNTILHKIEEWMTGLRSLLPKDVPCQLSCNGTRPFPLVLCPIRQ